MSNPRIIIAGTHSGCGKTTIAMGIIGSLVKRGMDVTPYKTGPDYIDPGFHSIAAGKRCRNLDTMMLDEDVVLELFDRESSLSDISIIEGVMGLFDGAGGLDRRGSAAHLSKVTGTPVILIIDVKAMAGSAGAIALGFKEFDPDLNLAGIIVNRVGSERHYEMVKVSIEENTGIPVLGYVPKNSDLIIPERHLGLIPAWEKNKTSVIIDKISEVIGTSIDLDSLIDIANSASSIPVYKKSVFIPSGETVSDEKPRIAVAWDNSFCFYYDDNLDMLKFHGAEIVYFSPMEDSSLPENISALYFGGGYPELFAEKLSQNKQILTEIRNFAEDGMPILAECGGFMYLCSELTDMDGTTYPMAGVFPGRTVMGKKLRSLGYCESINNDNNFLGKKGTILKGHMFHWANLENISQEEKFAFTIKKGEKLIGGGLRRNNAIGSWIHFHFGSNPSSVINFMNTIRLYKKKKGVSNE